MNVQLMRDYVEYVGDYLLSILGYSPLFYSKNPVSGVFVCLAFALRVILITRQFPYMETTAVGARTNFFERPAGDYIGSMSATSSVAG